MGRHVTGSARFVRPPKWWLQGVPEVWVGRRSSILEPPRPSPSSASRNSDVGKEARELLGRGFSVQGDRESVEVVVALPRLERLTQEVRDVLNEAIEAGGSSLRDYAQADGALGYFQHRFKIYDREGEPCATCKTPVKRVVQAGRSTFFCSRCQR